MLNNIPRYDSSRHEHRDRRNSYRNDDSKWPSRDTGHHHQSRSYQNYNEPKTTLVIKGVPQGMPADTVRIKVGCVLPMSHLYPRLVICTPD